MAPVYADHPYNLMPTPIPMMEANGEVPDEFDMVAAEMVLIHNLLIRGLNAIYLQAPYIQPKDEAPFLAFMNDWYNVIHHHHLGEETSIFPMYEERTGEKGLMDRNIEQHHAFQQGLTSFLTYVKECQAGSSKFDAAKIIQIIEAFGATLVEHLRDEIPTLQGLRRHADALPNFKKSFDEEGEKVMKNVGLTGLCHAFANMDTGFEDGRWAYFPPLPKPVLLFVRWGVWWFGASKYKFGATDRFGKLQPLYAIPADAN